MYIPKLTVALCDDMKSYISVEKANKEKIYYCPCCGGEVYPKALDSKFIKMHFCHKNDTCNNEDIRHFMKKWEFKNKNTIDELNLYYDYAEVEIEYKTRLGKYRPDVTLHLNDGKKVFLEIKNTNSKTSDYILKWYELNCDVIEYDINNDRYYYLYKNGEFCRKNKLNLDEKNQIEIIEYIRMSQLSKNRYEKLYDFWIYCRNYKSHQETEGLSLLLDSMNFDDILWCVNQLKKIKCQAEFINIIITKIMMKIKQSYIKKCIKFIQEGTGRYFETEPSINIQNKLLEKQYISFLEQIGKSYPYRMCTIDNLKLFWEWIWKDKSNKSIFDISEKDIEDFKCYLLHYDSLTPKQYRKILCTIRSVVSFANQDGMKSIIQGKRFEDLSGFNFYEYNVDFKYLNLKEYLKIYIRLYPLKANDVKEFGITQYRLNRWINDLEHSYFDWNAPQDDILLCLNKIERHIFGDDIFIDTLFNEIAKFLEIDITAKNKFDGWLDSISQMTNIEENISSEANSNLYDFIYYECEIGNDLFNVQRYVEWVIRIKRNEYNIRLNNVIEGIYMTFEYISKLNAR